MRKTIAYILVITLCFGSSLVDWHVSAESIGDVNKEIQDLDKERAELKDKQGNVSSEKQETEEQIDENLHKQDTVKSEIRAIDQKLTTTKTNIQTKENKIAATNEKIEQMKKKVKNLKSDIKELKKRIKKREVLLKNRLRAIQKNGGNMGYVGVILGAQSFGDFISRSSAVNVIMDQDKNILQEHAADKKSLEGKKIKIEKEKAEVENKKASLESQKQELVALKAQLGSQIAEKETLMGQLEEEQQHLEEHKMSLAEQQRVLNAQASIIEKAKRAAAQEKKKLEQEREKKRLEQLAKETQSGNSPNTSNNQLSAGGSGVFDWPASGRLSSGYGPRPAPYGYHRGIDIAASTGTPVHAAASGYITRSEWSDSYGNVIYVFHAQYNKTTVYAHLSSRSVSLGQQVGAGATIGAIGNTGDSYGSHLHFEVHNGGWGYHSGINPMAFLK